MIKAISGNDKISIQKYIDSLKLAQKNSGYNFIELSGYSKNKEKIADSLNTISLLQNIAIYHIYLDTNDLDIDIKSMQASNNLYIIDVSNLNGNTKVVKELKKLITIEKFDLKADFLAFNIAEAILIEQNLNKALNLAKTSTNTNDLIFSFISALNYYYKLLLQKHTNHSLFYKQKLFVQNKISRTKFTEKQLSALINTIFSYDLAIKSSKQLNIEKMLKDIYIMLKTP